MQTHSYTNPWYVSWQTWGEPAVFETTEKPKKYRDYLLFNRKGSLDIVQRGTLVRNVPCLESAKDAIDAIIDEPNTLLGLVSRSAKPVLTVVA